MRDFYPPEMKRRNLIFEAWKRASLAAGFSQYDACVVERMELLERKAGEEISAQIYSFRDKSGRRLALRPEMTPTLARMITARKGELRLPLKWFSIAQCFRYERMTRGRKREHYQWNLDIVGERDPGAEVEVLNTAAMAMRYLGIPDRAWRIHINSRSLLAELLTAQGVAPANHGAVFMALDKRGKIPEAEILSILAGHGIKGQLANRVFDLVNLASLEDAASVVGNQSPALCELRFVLDKLDAYGLGELVRFDLGVIRGLAYYTGIVFEAFDADKKSRAIFGGGRYDNLLNLLGGDGASAVGLGFGDVVIDELIHHTTAGPTPEPRSGILLGFMSEEERHPAIILARRLRDDGRTVDLATSPVKPRAFFSRADKDSREEAILLGPDEVATGQAKIKNLATGGQTTLPLVSRRS